MIEERKRWYEEEAEEGDKKELGDSYERGR
jgi:hypothetical protein